MYKISRSWPQAAGTPALLCSADAICESLPYMSFVLLQARWQNILFHNCKSSIKMQRICVSGRYTCIWNLANIITEIQIISAANVLVNKFPLLSLFLWNFFIYFLCTVVSTLLCFLHIVFSLVPAIALFRVGNYVR